MLAALHPCFSATLVGHERRRPEETLLYRTVQQHFGRFEAEVRDATPGDGLPSFIRAA